MDNILYCKKTADLAALPLKEDQVQGMMREIKDLNWTLRWLRNWTARLSPCPLHRLTYHYALCIFHFQIREIWVGTIRGPKTTYLFVVLWTCTKQPQKSHCGKIDCMKFLASFMTTRIFVWEAKSVDKDLIRLDVTALMQLPVLHCCDLAHGVVPCTSNVSNKLIIHR